jgi:hypothetical protein
MGPSLKPSKHGAVLIEEAVRAKLSGPVSEPERVELQQFADELDAYLRNR